MLLYLFWCQFYSVNILAFLPKRIREMSEYEDIYIYIYILETGIIECDISSTLCIDTRAVVFAEQTREFAVGVSFGGCANTDSLSINVPILTRVHEHLSIQSRLEFYGTLSMPAICYWRARSLLRSGSSPLRSSPKSKLIFARM